MEERGVQHEEAPETEDKRTESGRGDLDEAALKAGRERLDQAAGAD